MPFISFCFVFYLAPELISESKLCLTLKTYNAALRERRSDTLSPFYREHIEVHVTREPCF